METAITILKQHGPTGAVLVLGLFMHGSIQGLDERILGLDQKIQGLDQKFQGLDGQIQELRIDMVEEFKAVRSEMAAADQSIRSEMAEGFQAVRSDISDLGERMARVETRVEGIEERLDRDSE